MKTVITIVADLVRSLAMSGLAAASVLMLMVGAVAVSSYGLWWLWRRARG